MSRSAQREGTATRSPVDLPAFAAGRGSTRPGDAIAAWLQDGPAQLRTGVHAGAIAGTIAESGAPTYVYPEIAGYYLQWLAWRARTFGGGDALAARAAAVQQWLGTWLALAGPPQTRVHLAGSGDDWRNGAVFFFDVAMVARGLGSAAREGLVVPDAGIVAGVSRILASLIDADGVFAACRAHDARVTLPDRWSTRRGAFLAKAAAGVITAARTLPGISAPVAAAAHATFAASIEWTLAHPHAEAHPRLYALEGLLALPKDPRFPVVLAAVGTQLAALLAQAGTDGRLPETLDADAAARGPARVDVLAQALRIGTLLGAQHPEHAPDRATLGNLRDLLARQLRPSGAVAFAVDAPAAAACNVWAAMFADQALAFAAHPNAGTWRGGDPLIV